MHPVNKLLKVFGFRLSRTDVKSMKMDSKEREYREQYDDYYKQVVENNKRDFRIFKDYRYQGGLHPTSAGDIMSEFAASHLYKTKPAKVLDIGSYRLFILGMLCHFDLTTIDVRERKPFLENETILTCDAKALNLADNSFDSVISLGALAHFGLGRYGDEFDLDADIKAFSEMTRVMKPGGLLIFATLITGGHRHPAILFNRCRIYDYKMIREFCKSLDLIEEKFYHHRDHKFCSLDELNADPTPLDHPRPFDLYLGCWAKRVW